MKTTHICIVHFTTEKPPHTLKNMYQNQKTATNILILNKNVEYPRFRAQGQ